MVKKFLALLSLVLLSCESTNKSVKSLAEIEAQLLKMVPHLQDNTVSLSGSLGKKSGVLIPGGLIATSSPPFGNSGDFVSVDFSHTLQLQGVCLGHKNGIGLIRIISRFGMTKGFDFNIDTDPFKGEATFVSFSDRNAFRPSIRYISDLKKLDEETFTKLDDGGALLDFNEKLIAIYSHENTKFIDVKQMRKDWKDYMVFDPNDSDLDKSNSQ